MKKLLLSAAVAAASGAYAWYQAGTVDGANFAAPVGDSEIAAIQPRRLATTTATPTAATAPAPQAPLRTDTTSPVHLSDNEAIVPPVAPSAPAAAPTSLPSAPLPAESSAAPTLAAVAPRPSAPDLTIGAQRTPPIAEAETTPTLQSTQVLTTVPLPRLRPPVRAAAANAAGTTKVAAKTANTVPTPTPTRIASTGIYMDGTFTGPVVDAYWGLMQIQAVVQGGRLIGVRVVQYPSDRRTSAIINRQALPLLRDEVVVAQDARVDIISGATLSSIAFIQSLNGALGKAKSQL